MIYTNWSASWSNQKGILFCWWNKSIMRSLSISTHMYYSCHIYIGTRHQLLYNAHLSSCLLYFRPKYKNKVKSWRPPIQWTAKTKSRAQPRRRSRVPCPRTTWSSPRRATTTPSSSGPRTPASVRGRSNIPTVRSTASQYAGTAA